MKKLFGLLTLLLALLLGSCSLQPECQTAGEHTDSNNDGFCDECKTSVIVCVDFYAINDLHGKFADSSTQIGVDELTTYLKMAYHTDENTVFLATGDMWQGSPESNLTDGLIVTEWMNSLGFAAMTIGNHEFDFGEEVIEKNLELAEFPFLAINVYEREGDVLAAYCTPSLMIESGGAKIGIIGAIGDCYSSISPDKTEDVYFKVGDELTALVRSEADRLRSLGADFIVYSIHDGYGKSKSGTSSVTANEIASYYDTVLSNGYVDLVFEAHTHQSYVIVDSLGVCHVQNGGDNSKGISHVEVNINCANESYKINSAKNVPTSSYESLSDDAIVNTLLDKYAEEIALGNQSLGTNSYYRNSEYIEALVARLYLGAGMEKWGEEYDVVLGGGFIKARSPYRLEAGDVTYGDLQSLMPFDNELTLCSVSGYYLKTKFLETKNEDYHVALSEYGRSIAGNIDENATYYIVVDSYTAFYAPNHLTVVSSLGGGVYARDLLAEYVKSGGLE